MDKLLISACLCGAYVRYDGKTLALDDDDLAWLSNHFELVTCCPEVDGGLSTPRPPAEIIRGCGGDVLDGNARVVANTGVDVSDAFLRGARLALELCQQQDIRFALLSERSPSCGSRKIYDGTFSGTKIDGRGVTAELLERNGIHVVSQFELATLKELVQ